MNIDAQCGMVMQPNPTGEVINTNMVLCMAHENALLVESRVSG